MKVSEYYESSQKIVHNVSVVAFVWDIGKTTYEGWHSVLWFILELNFTLGIVYVVCIGVLVIVPFVPLIVLGLFTLVEPVGFKIQHGAEVSGTRFIVGFVAIGVAVISMFALIDSKFFGTYMDFIIKTPYLFISIALFTVLISTALDLANNMPEDYTLVIRFFGWVAFSMVISLGLVYLYQRISAILIR